MIKLEQTHVAAPTLGQRGIKVQAAVAHDIRQIAQQQLLLQRHGRRRDHQFFAPGPRDRQCCDKISDRLSRTCTGLNHCDGGLGLRVSQSVGDLCNHLALPPARHQIE